MKRTSLGFACLLLTLFLFAAGQPATGAPQNTQTATPTICIDITHPDTITTSSGLSYQVTRVCTTGAVATKGAIVKVGYVGRLKDGGNQFDSSSEHGGPFSFTLGAGQVIKGWDEGIEGMRVGEKRTLIIPPDLAYGTQGVPPTIPANAILVFDVELVTVGSGLFTPTPGLLPTWTPIPTETVDPGAFDMSTATVYKTPDDSLEIKLPKLWQNQPSNQPGMFVFNYGAGTGSETLFQVAIGRANDLYANTLQLTGTVENPQAALATFKKSNESTATLKFGDTRPVKIGKYDGYGLAISVSGGGQGGPDTEVEVWIAQISNTDQIVMVIMQVPSPLWISAKPTLYNMAASLVIHLQNIPTPTPTPTLHPLRLTQTAVEKQIDVLTPTAPTATPPATTVQ